MIGVSTQSKFNWTNPVPNMFYDPMFYTGSALQIQSRYMFFKKNIITGQCTQLIQVLVCTTTSSDLVTNIVWEKCYHYPLLFV